MSYWSAHALGWWYVAVSSWVQCGERQMREKQRGRKIRERRKRTKDRKERKGTQSWEDESDRETRKTRKRRAQQRERSKRIQNEKKRREKQKRGSRLRRKRKRKETTDLNGENAGNTHHPTSIVARPASAAREGQPNWSATRSAAVSPVPPPEIIKVFHLIKRTSSRVVQLLTGWWRANDASAQQKGWRDFFVNMIWHLK